MNSILEWISLVLESIIFGTVDSFFPLLVFIKPVLNLSSGHISNLSVIDVLEAAIAVKIDSSNFISQFQCHVDTISFH